MKLCRCWAILNIYLWASLLLVSSCKDAYIHNNKLIPSAPHQEESITLPELYETSIIEKILYLEKTAGYKLDTSAIKLLQNWRCNMQLQNFSIDPNESRLTKKNKLKWLGSMLTDSSLLIQEYHSSMTTCLNYRIFDCDILSMLYTDLATGVGVSLNTILLPQHIVVLYRDYRDTIVWETTKNRESSYHKLYNQYAIPDNQWMYPNYDQLVLVGLYNIAKDKSDKNSFELPIVLLEKIITLWPAWQNPYRLLGHCYYKIDNCEDAIKHYQTYLLHNPWHIQAQLELNDIQFVHQPH